jgi:hypothetical protein
MHPSPNTNLKVQKFNLINFNNQWIQIQGLPLSFMCPGRWNCRWSVVRAVEIANIIINETKKIYI